MMKQTLKRTGRNMQYACFFCRKVFKQPDLKEASGHFVTAIQAHASKRKIREINQERFCCPECGKPMEIMGRNFRAPRKENKREWKKVELLVQKGFRFFSSGWEERGSYPKTLGELASFLQKEHNRPVG